MHDFIVALSINVSLLIIWFHTNVLVDYANVFGLGRLFKGYNRTGYYSLLTTYLRENKKIISKCPCVQFYLKLITCPICLCFWTSILVSFFTIGFYNFIVLYVTSLFCYFIFNKLIQ